MEKIIVWGEKRSYKLIESKLHQLSSEGDALILSVFLADSFPMEADASDPVWSDASLIVVCSRFFSDDQIEPVLQMKIQREQIIPSELILLPGFSFSRYLDLIHDRISILSNTCWGGLTYHYFRLKMLSPTINMWMSDEDYIRFLNELDLSLSSEPVFLETHYDSHPDTSYPVLSLNGIRLNMNHSLSAEQAISDWERRKTRINRDNLFVMMMTSSPEAAERFSSLRFRKKACFVPFKTDIPGCITLCPGSVPLNQYVNSLAIGSRVLYDPWTLLEKGEFTVPHDTGVIAGSAYPAVSKSSMLIMLQSKRFLIYGAWELGRRALKLMKYSIDPESICGFSVTDTAGNPDTVEGLPVYSLKEWESFFDDESVPKEQVTVILGLNPRYYHGVREELNDYGFPNALTLEEFEDLIQDNEDEAVHQTSGNVTLERQEHVSRVIYDPQNS